MGGLAALGKILSNLPLDFGLPIAIVQHRRVESGELLIRELRRFRPVGILEPCDKEPVAPGYIYIAPADLSPATGDWSFPPLHGRPGQLRKTIDRCTFESAADAYGNRAMAVVLTGRQRGRRAGERPVSRKSPAELWWLKTPDEAECPVMPRAVMHATTVEHVLTLSEIAAFLVGVDAAQR